MIVDSVRHIKLFVFRPAIVSLGKPDLFFTQWFAVGAAGILFVRGAIADVAVHDDQRRAIVRALKVAERAGQHIEVICVTHPRHVPAIADKARGHVFSKSQRSVAFDRDVVVVVNPAEI